MTFQQKCTNFRDFYLVKKGPKNLGIGKPPPHFRAMPESKRLFSTDVFPYDDKDDFTLSLPSLQDLPK